MTMIYTLDKERAAIEVRLPAANEGKYRFKKRSHPNDFGVSFAARTEKFDENVYLEWQIGYDAVDKDVDAGIKQTQLRQLCFTGANNKRKHPYELSELVYYATMLGLVETEDLVAIKDFLSTSDDFLAGHEIRTETGVPRVIRGVNFNATNITLPTFIMSDTPDGIQIEVSIQKQQYAAGVQPMLYMCIPITRFANGQGFIGKKSKTGDELIYVINKQNSINLLQMLRIFGMCSASHKKDISEILDVLIAAIQKENVPV